MQAYDEHDDLVQRTGIRYNSHTRVAIARDLFP